MYKMLLWLFPLALPFLTFAEGGGEEESETDSDEKSETDQESDEESDQEETDEDKDKDEGDLTSVLAELKRTRTALRSANKEAKERRLKLKRFEEEETKRKQADMSELEVAKEELGKATTERDLLRKANTSLIIRHAIELGATKLGFVDPVDAFTLIDLSKVEVDAETQKIEGVEQALKALVKAKPYLLNADQDDQDDKGGSRGTPRSTNKRRTKPKKDALPERSMANL